MLWSYRATTKHVHTPVSALIPVSAHIPDSTMSVNRSSFRCFSQGLFQMLCALKQETKKQLWARSQYTWVQWVLCSLNWMWEHFLKDQICFDLRSQIISYTLASWRCLRNIYELLNVKGWKPKRFCTMELSFANREASETAAICLSKSVGFFFFWLLMIMGSFQCLLYTQVLMIITAEASCEVTNLLLHYEEVKDEKIRRQDQSLKARDSSDWHWSQCLSTFPLSITAFTVSLCIHH